MERSGSPDGPTIPAGSPAPQPTEPIGTGARPGAAGPDERAAPPLVGRRLGPYAIDALLGAGGMGAVYGCRHVQTGQRCALKVLRVRASEVSDEEIARFRREAEVLARIDDHPGIVRFHTFGADGGVLYTVMEHVEGETLEDLTRDGPLAPERAAHIGIAIGRALQHVHDRGVLHRDLKPANVIVDRLTGAPRLLDFGLAHDALGRRLTRSGDMLGTPAYMAPEQIDDTMAGQAVGPASDVYGLGAILYRLLTGRPPYEGDGAIAVMSQVLSSAPRAPRVLVPGLPRDLEAVCVTAMAREVESRYRTAADVADDLARWVDGRPTRARASSGMQRVVRILIPARGERRTRRLALLVTAAIGAAAAGGLVVYQMHASRQEHRRRVADQEARELRDALDDALERIAQDGGLPSITAADEIHRRLVARDASAANGEARAVLDTLARLAGGDSLVLRAMDLERPPLSRYRRHVVRVVLESPRTEPLQTLMEKQPDLLDELEVVGRLIEPIIEGRVALSESAMSRLLGTLDAACDDRRDAPDALREARVRLLESRLVRQAAAGPVDRAALFETAGLLMHALRASGRRVPGIEQEQLERIADLVIDQTNVDAGAPGLPALAEVVLLGLPAEQKRVDLIEAIGMKTFAIGLLDEIGRGPAFELGLVMYRSAAMPMPLEELAHFAPESIEALVERAWEAVRSDPPHPELVTLIAVLVQRRRIELRQGGIYPAQGTPRALLDHWDLIAPVLEREQAHGDTPTWALSWIARTLGEGLIFESARPDDPAVLDALVSRLRELDGPLLGRAPIELIDTLHARAVERNRSAPGLALMEPRIPLARAVWLRLSHRPIEAVEPIVEALDLFAERHRGVGDIRGMGTSNTPRRLEDEAFELCIELCNARDGHERDPCPLHETLDRIVGAMERAWPTERDALPAQVRAYHAIRHGRVAEGVGELARQLEDERRVAAFRLLVDSATLLLRLGREEDARRAVAPTLARPVASDQRIYLLSRSSVLKQLGEEALAAEDERVFRAHQAKRGRQ